MLTITVLGEEHFNEETQEFSTEGDFVLELEHSLVALSKWESIYEKPFLDAGIKTTEEVLGYIKAMVLTLNVPPEVFSKLSKENYEQINTYIDSKRSATWFAETPNAPQSREVITSELVYYWMIALTVPMECENWHLNRLFSLLKICNIKNGKPKKMSKSELAQRNSSLNAQRKAQLGTTG